MSKPKSDASEVGEWTSGPIITPDGGKTVQDPSVSPGPGTPAVGPITVPVEPPAPKNPDGFHPDPVKPLGPHDEPPANPNADAIIVTEDPKS